MALLQVAFQLVLLVEHYLKEAVVSLLRRRDSGQEPEQTQARLMRIVQTAYYQPMRPMGLSLKLELSLSAVCGQADGLLQQ